MSWTMALCHQPRRRDSPEPSFIEPVPAREPIDRPSTGSVAAVTFEAASDRRYAMAAAASSGWPHRSNACTSIPVSCESLAASCAGSWARSASTVRPRSFRARRRSRVSRSRRSPPRRLSSGLRSRPWRWHTAGIRRRDAVPDGTRTLTIAPPLCASRNARTAAEQPTTAGFRLRTTSSATVPADAECSDASWKMAALLTQPSKGAWDCACFAPSPRPSHQRRRRRRS